MEAPVYFVFLSRVFRKDFRFWKVLISSYNFTFSVFRNFDYFPTTDKLPLSLPLPFPNPCRGSLKAPSPIKNQVDIWHGKHKTGRIELLIGFNFWGKLYSRGAGQGGSAW